jgi:hypothetical protein
MSKFIFAGDSFAEKGFTEHNCDCVVRDTDVCLADHWTIPYTKCVAPGEGNLTILDKVVELKSDLPIIWVWTEPGRDYGRITGRSEFEWIEREDLWELRQSLTVEILKEIKKRLSQPVALVGGLSDIDSGLAQSFGFAVLESSWQRWIANKLNSQWFRKGWGALDVGWRSHYNGITPGKTATMAWDEQIKEWCWWQEQGYFYSEHPTPRANLEFAEFLLPTVTKWIDNNE